MTKKLPANCKGCGRWFLYERDKTFRGDEPMFCYMCSNIPGKN